MLSLVSRRSHMVQATVTVSQLEAMKRTFVHHDRHLFLCRETYGSKDFKAECRDPCLKNCRKLYVRVCEEPTWCRLLCCPQQVQERLLGTLEGYRRHPNASQWLPEDLLKMLLANEAVSFPHMWIQKEIVGTLGPAVLTHFPQVAEWVRTFDANSQPMRLFIIRRMTLLTITFEQ